MIQKIFKLGQVKRVELVIQSYCPVIFYVLLQKNVPNQKNLTVQVVAMNNWSNLNIARHFEPGKTNSLVKDSLAQIVGSSSKPLFCKVTRETKQKGPTSNANFNHLHLSQLKNLLDPGFIEGEIQRMLLSLFFFSKISVFWNTIINRLNGYFERKKWILTGPVPRSGFHGKYY